MLKQKFTQHLNNKFVEMSIAEVENEIVEKFELFGND
jgi:hypothetical protein